MERFGRLDTTNTNVTLKKQKWKCQMKKNLRTFFVRTVRALFGDCRHVFLWFQQFCGTWSTTVQSQIINTVQLRAQLIIFTALQ